jgi:tyrosinase
VVDSYRGKPLQLPDPAHDFHRADLVFHGLDHSGPTYEGRIFLGAKRGIKHGAGVDHPAYAGSFYLFGHGSCHGDEGHCDVPTDRDPFDLRLPHHLEPAVQIVTVTDAVKRLVGEGRTAAAATVFAHGPDGRALKTLDFARLRLLTYA